MAVASPTSSLQDQLNGITNAFAGTTYQPGTAGQPGRYIKPNATQTVSPQQPIYNPQTNSYGLPTMGTPTWNGTAFVNEQGQPFTGTYGGQTYTNGQSQQQVANSQSRYQGISIAKNPTVSAAATQIGANLKPTTGVTDFSDLLNAARTATGAATNDFSSDQNAYNVQPLSDTLNSLNAGYAATGNALNNQYTNTLANTAANQNNIVNQATALLPQQYQALQGINNQFANTASGLDANYSNVLGNTNATENNILQQEQNLLPSYDQAANNIGDAQTAALQQDVSRYKLGTGTPASLGGGEEQLLTNGVANIRLPLAEQEINQRYNLLENQNLPVAQQQQAAALGQIQNFELPVAQQEQSQNYGTQAGLNQAQQNILQNIALPLATQQGQAQVQQLTNFTAPQAQQDYTNAATTAQTIQNLKIQTAGMGIADATRYLQSMAVPAQIQQQILAANQSLQGGDISNLGGLNSVLGGSNYQGLQDLLGANLSTPTVSTFSPGRYPTGTTSGSRYSLPTASNITGTSGAAPVAAAPQPQAQPQPLPQGAWASTLQAAGTSSTGQVLYKDPKTGSLFTVINGQIYPYQPQQPIVDNGTTDANGYPTSYQSTPIIDNTGVGGGDLVAADDSNADEAGG